jgi:hypothetical protein
LQVPAVSFVRFAHELAPEVDVRVLPVGGTLSLSPDARPAVGLRVGACS